MTIKSEPVYVISLAKSYTTYRKGNDTISVACNINDVNSIAYFHDGRAHNLNEAILWHGDEAEKAKTAY